MKKQTIVTLFVMLLVVGFVTADLFDLLPKLDITIDLTNDEKATLISDGIAINDLKVEDRGEYNGKQIFVYYTDVDGDYDIVEVVEVNKTGLSDNQIKNEAERLAELQLKSEVVKIDNRPSIGDSIFDKGDVEIKTGFSLPI